MLVLLQKFFIFLCQAVLISVELKLSWTLLTNFSAMTSTKVLKGQFLQNNIEDN